MLAGAKNVRMMGTQTIDGVQTTRYTGTFTLAAAMAKVPPAFRAMVQKVKPLMQAFGFTVEHFTVWVDAQHRVRKLATAESGSSERMTTSYQIDDFNPVSVSPPPASQVLAVPASALTGS
jgi:hypothetical protein